jgi:subtilisin-like proprotein convertase family protein
MAITYSVWRLFVVFAGVFFLISIGSMQGQTTFTNSAAITSPVGAGTPGGFPPGPGVPYSPYPSNIDVSGLSGTISKVIVTLNNVSLDRPDDLVVLLQGPTGANLVVVSDAGGTSGSASNVTLTLDDAAASLLPDNGPLTGGTFKPTAVRSSAENFPAPAPAQGDLVFPAPFGSATLASQFNGTNPNGQWKLFVVDDALGPPTGIGGTIAGGWSITITTAIAAAPTATTLSSSPNPSFTTAPDSIATFTATVTSSGSPVTTGTVTFFEGSTVLAANVALNGSGQATFATSSLGQGAHTIRADYSGATGFAVSSGTVSHFVHNHTVQTGNTFCNPGPISIAAGSSAGPDPAIPYPSSIFVTGLSGSITSVTLVLNGLTSARPDDLDLLLVRGGSKFVFMSDAGGQNAVSGINLTFSDTAASLLSSEGTLTSGTFRPTSDTSPGGVNFPAPAPAAPYNRAAPVGADTFSSTFSGSPNGTWELFVVDDALGGGTGSIGSYCLTFGTTSDAPTTTTLTSSQNPSFTSAPGNSVTFTAEVNRTSDGTNVTVGTVTFREGATVLAGPVALNASGTASFTTTSLSEGMHVITADYSGSPGAFNFSSGNITQTVDNHTVVTGNTFCNPGPLTINTNGSATPYPSRIFVSGLGAALSGVTLSLNGLTHPRPDDIDVLLVSPSGQNFVPMSDTGGTNAVTGITLTLSDSAASQIPDDTTLTTGTFRPTSVNALGQNAFPSPAPSGPYNNAAPAGSSTFASLFTGTNPNGTWSLLVVDDALGQAGTFAGGACLTFTLPSDLSISKSHAGNFSEGQAGALYTITVTNSGTADTTGTVTVSDTLPAGLTATAIAGTGWNCNLATLTCTRSDVLASGASYPAITLTVNVANDAPVSVTNTANVSGGGELNTANNTATDPTTIIQTVSVTVNTAPAGRSFTVDGTTYTTAQTFAWLIGSMHDLSTTSPQNGGVTRYVWENWSDAGGISHTVTTTAATTYTANFKTQHQLTTSVSPAGSGVITPATGYFDQGASVQVNASANAGFTFVNFSGDLTGSTNPQSVVMSAPRSVVANFTGTPTTLTALITAKSGPANARVWTITLTNSGAGTAASALVSGLTLSQTGGAACTPSIVGPLPLTIGNIAPGGSAAGNLTLNFTGCAATARFTAVISYGANNGAIATTKTLFNQFQ